MKFFSSYKSEILSAIALISLTASAASAIPTTTWEGVEIPDWNQISFGDLPAIQETGGFQSTPEINNMAGYNMSRTWASGQNSSEFLKLGDFATSFKLQDFSLNAIASLVGNDLTSLSLEDFGVIPDQTLEGLVNAIPDLAQEAIASLPPINDLLTTSLGATFDPNQTLGELLSSSPMTGTLELGQIDLSQYGIDSIPGVTSTPIGNFENWQNSFIDEIPGLPEVSFSQFPGGIAGTGTNVGTADLILKDVEQKRDRTISGSDKEGFTVPCETNCAHVELAGSQKVMGRQWISGKYQEVSGGFGILGQANGRKEPTGIHPFGEAFKMALWEVNSDESAISSMLFFRICKRGVPDLGCTPYIIGGVPFMTFNETMPMFLGKVEDLPASSTQQQLSLNSTETTSNSANSPFTSDSFTNSEPSCSSSVNIDALTAAFNADMDDADIADMASLINIASSQIDPTTQLPFTGDRLIERIAQMHFGGVGIPIDSTATDVNGLSAADYGTQTKEVYQDFQKSSCP